jgi:ATP-dependent Clp protease ATP-binding subunit ClpB
VIVALDEKAKEWAAEKGHDPVFGARPLKRFLQHNIETKLARAHQWRSRGELRPDVHRSR